MTSSLPKSFRALLALALFSLLIGGCTSTPRNLRPNLPSAKRAVVDYVLGGQYEADIREALQPAREKIAHLKPSTDTRPPALILDVDDTAISTWEFQKRLQFGFDYARLQEWRKEAKAPAIEPVLELYKYAREHGWAVFFVTGRRERDRETTIKTLEGAGYKSYEGLIMRPNETEGITMVVFKAGSRSQIEDRGYRVLVNVGDQQSDVLGGFAELSIKLPNPFYEVE